MSNASPDGQRPEGDLPALPDPARFDAFLDRLEAALQRHPNRIRFDTEWAKIVTFETATDAGTIGPETDAQAA